MNDDEIINLFLKRDENGIIELSTKYHSLLLQDCLEFIGE